MTTRWVSAFTDDVLGTMDATALGQQLATGAITPLQATEAAIARCQQVEPLLHAIALPLYDQARHQAARLTVGPQAAMFAGVPTAIKDNADLAGQPTQFGATAFTARPARRSDAFVRQFLAQQMVPLAKTRLPEFGFSGSTEYQDGTAVCNPWNTGYTAGGSSGGAGALVASGALPIAHGNDGGGSIRIPAACNGLVGLKVSRGRVHQSRLAGQLPVKLIAEGVLTRSVRDTANFIYQAEQYYHNPKLPRIGQVTAPGTRRLRIGLQMQSVAGELPDDATQATVEAAATLLRDLGHQVQPFQQPLPRSFVDAFIVYYGFMAFSVQQGGRFTFGRDFDPRKLDNLSKGLARQYRKHFYQTPQAILQYRRAQALFAQSMRDVDVILSPVLGYATPRLGYLSPAQDYETKLKRLIRFAGYTPLQNTLGSPAIALPLGQNDDGLPMSFQLAAAPGQERILLELAFEIEAASPFVQIQDIAP